MFRSSHARRRRLALTVLTLAAAGAAPAAAQESSSLDLTKLGRPAEEVARDATSKPLEVYRFFGIDEGDVVADLIAGGGYNTAILTHLVGPEGVVFSHNVRNDAIKKRVAEGDLKGRANVVVFDELSELPDDTLDVALTVRNYHDVPQAEIGNWLKNVYRALKPGGTLAVIDVRTKPGFEGRATDLHRISEQTVVSEVKAAGFEFAGGSDLLANPDDKYESSEFENREQTNRMVLKFTKPGGGEGAGATAPREGGAGA